MSNLKVVILSHNRPELLKNSIKSFIEFNYPRENILISDNSNVKFKHRVNQISCDYNVGLINSNTISLYDHFNSSFSSIKDDYILFFHDDDLVKIQYKILIKYLKKYFVSKNSIAINFNGYIIRSNNQIIKESLWRDEKDHLNIDKNSLVHRYLDNDKGGIAPWCGYIYNFKEYRSHLISSIKNIKNKNDLYFDTYFILNLLSHGEIYWININSYLIRIHDLSISANTINSYKLFYIYAKNNFKNIPIKSLVKYRRRNLLSLLFRKRKNLKIQIIFFIYLFCNSKYLRYKFTRHIIRIILKK